MPVTANESVSLSNLLKVKDPVFYQAGYCTEQVTVNEAAAVDYKVGDLVGIVTGTGKGVLATSAAINGSENIYGVVVENKSIPATTDTKVEVLVRGAAILADGGLNATQVADYTLAAVKTALAAKNPAILVGAQL